MTQPALSLPGYRGPIADPVTDTTVMALRRELENTAKPQWWATVGFSASLSSQAFTANTVYLTPMPVLSEDMVISQVQLRVVVGLGAEVLHVQLFVVDWFKGIFYALPSSDIRMRTDAAGLRVHEYGDKQPIVHAGKQYFVSFHSPAGAFRLGARSTTIARAVPMLTRSLPSADSKHSPMKFEEMTADYTTAVPSIVFLSKDVARIF